jgi:hypothetical protein
MSAEGKETICLWQMTTNLLSDCMVIVREIASEVISCTY